jgi:HK97 family phage portal protein
MGLFTKKNNAKHKEAFFSWKDMNLLPTWNLGNNENEKARAKDQYNSTTQSPPRDYRHYAEETYMKNLITFKCMDAIGKAVSSIDWKVYKKIEDGMRKEEQNHPMNNILRRANTTESFNWIVLSDIVYLMIAGNSYLQKSGVSTGSNAGTIKELYSLDPSKMKLEVDASGNVSKYIYDEINPYPVNILTGQSDILHKKLFNPIDRYFGASVTESAAREIDSSNEATNWQKKMLENEGRPGLIYSVKGSLTDEQFERIKTQLHEKYSGSENAGKSLVLESIEGSQVIPYNWSPKEIDFIESNRELARKICLAYGVPPQLLGIPGDSTYSNYKEARLGFYEDTVFWYMNYFRTEFNNWAFKDDGRFFIDYDLNDIPALAPKREIAWERAQKSDFITLNEKRKMVGKEAVKGGDVFILPNKKMIIDAKTMKIIFNPDENKDDEDKDNNKE